MKASVGLGAVCNQVASPRKRRPSRGGHRRRPGDLKRFDEVPRALTARANAWAARGAQGPWTIWMGHQGASRVQRRRDASRTTSGGPRLRGRRSRRRPPNAPKRQGSPPAQTTADPAAGPCDANRPTTNCSPRSGRSSSAPPPSAHLTRSPTGRPPPATCGRSAPENDRPHGGPDDAWNKAAVAWELLPRRPRPPKPVAHWA